MRFARSARKRQPPSGTGFITDYDCWKVDDEPVTAEIVIGHLLANDDAARQLLPNIIRRIPTEPTWPEHRVLDSALVTDRKLWPELTVKKLEVILKRFLQSHEL